MAGEYCASHALRTGCTCPFSSVARLCSTAAWPVHSHGSRKRTRHLGRSSPVSAASTQVAPPSADTSTRRMRPAPLQAIPEISYKPGRGSVIVEDGLVITDFTPISKVNCNARPSGSGSVYLDVSSLVWVGPAVAFRRRSHFTLVLPSQPGSSRRTG